MVRSSKMDSDAVSSMNRGELYRFLTLDISWSHSICESCPLFIFSPSISQVFCMRRLTSWRFDISSENMATGML